MDRSISITVSLPEKVLIAVENAAKSETRTRSGQITHLILLGMHATNQNRGAQVQRPVQPAPQAPTAADDDELWRD